MKAVVITKYGDSSVLEYRENIDIPKTKPNQVLIKNKATSINPIDLMKREGYGKEVFEKIRKNKFPWILGCDVSGIIVEVGSKVTRFKKGQEVWGCTSGVNQGTYAEYTALYQNEISLKPKNINFLEASAIPYVALSTWSALIRWAGLKPSDLFNKRVFVQAGAGGVGSFAIQLLSHWGSKIATTCSKKNNQFLNNLGAEFVINYNEDDFSKVLLNYDLVLDLLGDLGGEESVIKSIGVLSKKTSSHYISLNHSFLRTIDEKGLFLGFPSALIERQKFRQLHKPINVHWSLYRPNPSALELIAKLVEQEVIKPVIDTTFKLEEIKKAHQKVSTGHTVGKAVIEITND